MGVSAPKDNKQRVVDEELAKEMAADRQKTSFKENVPSFRPRDGKKEKIRILPGEFGRSGKKFYAVLTQHWVEKDGKRFPFDCPRFHFDDECPYCNAADEANRNIEELEQARTQDKVQIEINKRINKACYPRTAFAMNVIDRQEPQPIVRLYRAPKTVFAVVEGHFTNDGPYIIDPIDGHDFNISRSTANSRTDYSTTIDLDASPLDDSEQVMEQLLDGLHNLDKLVSRPKMEEMEELLDKLIADIEDETRSELGKDRARESRRSAGSTPSSNSTVSRFRTSGSAGKAAETAKETPAEKEETQPSDDKKRSRAAERVASINESTPANDGGEPAAESAEPETPKEEGKPQPKGGGSLMARLRKSQEEVDDIP